MGQSINWRMQVNQIDTNLNIRTGPGVQYDVVGQLVPMEVRVFVWEDVGWFQMPDYNWCCGDYLTMIEDLDKAAPTQVTDAPASPTVAQTQTTYTGDQTNGSGADVSSSNLLDDVYVDPADDQIDWKTTFSMDTTVNPDIVEALTNLKSIWGMPHQFTKEADVRYGKWEYGRKYSDTFLSDAPIMIVTPGRANFMTGAQQNKKEGILSLLTNSGGDSTDDTTINDILKDDKLEYYTFYIQYAEYMKYVNSLCRQCAINMGMDGKNNPSKIDYRMYNWSAVSMYANGGASNMIHFLRSID